MKTNSKDIIDWYVKYQSVYKSLSKKIESILIELMEINKLEYQATYSREKQIDSFGKKIDRKEYSNPKKEITDLAGIRIITYVESQIDPIREIIEETFDIDWGNSSDKSEELGIDKVGYKSIHYVAKLKSDRLLLPEYKRFKDMYFEIQVRTILQHAWAEIEHDRNYKFSGVLPKEIQRRFKLLAGLLETADSEFNSISNSIDSISGKIVAETKKGNLNILINSTSLKEYLPIKFKELGKALEHDFVNSEREKKLVDELTNFGLKTLQDLDEIIPDDFVKKFKASGIENNYNGLLTKIMLINNAEKFFQKAWSPDHWKKIAKETTDFLEDAYKISLNDFITKYDLGRTGTN